MSVSITNARCSSMMSSCSTKRIHSSEVNVFRILVQSVFGSFPSRLILKRWNQALVINRPQPIRNAPVTTSLKYVYSADIFFRINIAFLETRCRSFFCISVNSWLRLASSSLDRKIPEIFARFFWKLGSEGNEYDQSSHENLFMSIVHISFLYFMNVSTTTIKTSFGYADKRWLTALRIEFGK